MLFPQSQSKVDRIEVVLFRRLSTWFPQDAHRPSCVSSAYVSGLTIGIVRQFAELCCMASAQVSEAAA